METFQWQPSGMGYIIRSSNGRFVVIDGGYTYDAEEFVSVLEQYSEGKPDIALWLLSHPHRDHVGVMYECASNPSLRDRINVSDMAFRLPSNVSDFGEDMKFDMATEAAVTFTGRVPSVSRGDRFTADDIEIEILYTIDNCPTLDDGNETSMIFRVSVAGQSIFFPGDAYEGPCEYVVKYLDSDIKSDFCQMAHHGLNGGNSRLYRLIQPKYLLVPVSRAGFREITEGKYKDDDIGDNSRAAYSLVDRENIFVSGDGTKVFELPFGR